MKTIRIKKNMEIFFQICITYECDGERMRKMMRKNSEEKNEENSEENYDEMIIMKI